MIPISKSHQVSVLRFQYCVSWKSRASRFTDRLPALKRRTALLGARHLAPPAIAEQVNVESHILCRMSHTLENC